MGLAPEESLKSLVALTRFFRGRIVLVPAYVCSAVLYAVEWVGAKPVFVDVDEETGCVDPEHMAAQAAPETLAAVVAYLFGHPGKKDLPERSNLAWIEDIAQAIGAQRNGTPVGSQGHSAVCSFYATKVITTGSGGMVLTRDPEAGGRLERLLQYDNQSDGLLHLSWAMSDLQAALGLAQWQELEERIQRRRQIAGLYSETLAEQALIEALPTTGPSRRGLIEGHIYYRYPIRLRRGLEKFIEGMRQEGVEVKRPVFTPLYRLRGGDPEAFPVTEKLFATTASLPIYPELTDDEAEHVARAAKRVLAAL
jgi:dTDP-4-amino-4,6-dideoxygalactose transaminase